MTDWKITAIIIAVLAVAGAASICAAFADETNGEITPQVVCVEYDSTKSTNIIITTDINFENRICHYQIYNKDNALQFSGIAMSPSNVFSIDSTKGTHSMTFTDGVYHLFFDQTVYEYEFSIMKVVFNGNGTAFKSTTAHLSTDTLSNYGLPAGYNWNTNSNGTGAWISDLSLADFGDDCSLTLYAFKSGSTGISIVSDTFTVIPGADATVILELDNNSGISRLDLSIGYDRSAMKLKSVSAGSIMTLGKNSTSDYPFVASLSSKINSLGLGTLLTLTFTVSSDAIEGQYPVKITVTSAEDQYGKLLPSSATGCAITVGEKMRGDLDGNGRINALDSLILKKYIAHNPVSVSEEDLNLNGDTRVNALDSLLLKRYIAHNPVIFADFPNDEVSMTITESGSTNEIEGVYVGESVFVSSESGTSATVTANGSAVSVTPLGSGRFTFVAPSSKFSVNIH